MGEPYDDLYLAIGRVVYEWSWLEQDIAALIFDLSAIHSRQFYEDDGVGVVSEIFAEDIDLRTNISIAKSLAKQVVEHPDLFDRVEAILNTVNAELRNERNRYVHDTWFVLGKKPIRYKRGTSIRKVPPSGEKALELGAQKVFESFEEVSKLADAIHEARNAVIDASEHARKIYRLKYPPEE